MKIRHRWTCTLVFQSYLLRWNVFWVWFFGARIPPNPSVGRLGVRNNKTWPSWNCGFFHLKRWMVPSNSTEAVVRWKCSLKNNGIFTWVGGNSNIFRFHPKNWRRGWFNHQLYSPYQLVGRISSTLRTWIMKLFVPKRSPNCFFPEIFQADRLGNMITMTRPPKPSQKLAKNETSWGIWKGNT